MIWYQMQNALFFVCVWMHIHIRITCIFGANMLSSQKADFIVLAQKCLYSVLMNFKEENQLILRQQAF